MKFRWQSVLAAILFFVSIPLLVWGFWPPRRETVTVPLILPAGMPSLPEARTVRLTFSPVMRAGDSQIVEMNLVAEGEGGETSVYEEYSVIAEARLDLSLTDVRPADTVSAALVKGGGATFYWEVSPREDGLLRGTVWLYLRFVPKADGEETRQPVSARLLEIRSRSLLKRTGAQARVVGTIGFVLGLAILILVLWSRRKTL
ncbi:MAG: hypothetical protein C4583_14790 [Anaerolineaceae bacterium]|nr:MAG: hypothetical protein C4583_14790 [Anaerolineaceae bacterium]